MLALVLGSLSGTGCLIAEAPTYGAPRRTVPVIDDLSVTPLPSFFLSVKSGVAQRFSMTVRSEDAGESLIAAWVIDYEDAQERELPLGVAAKVPARAADQPKTLTCDFIPDSRVTKGCHSLTLLVMHERSFDDVKRLPLDDAKDDVAAITWFVQVETLGSGDEAACPTL
jgi:hypothetical protein